VATYDYRCGDCGCFEQRMPMGTAMATVACPSCGRDAKRIFSVPMMYPTPKPLARMLAREEARRGMISGVDCVAIRKRRYSPELVAPKPVLPLGVERDCGGLGTGCGGAEEARRSGPGSRRSSVRPAARARGLCHPRIS
jgi:putative FmdB family regulatory protein